MKCSYCHKEIEDGSAVCPQCGHTMAYEVMVNRRGPGLGQWILIGLVLALSVFLLLQGYYVWTRVRGSEVGAILFFVFGGLLPGVVVSPIVSFIFNLRKKTPCCEYDPATGNFVFHPLYRGDIVVAPRDYVTCRRYFLTYWVFIIYVRVDGETKKIKLGWTDDIVPFRIRASQLRF